MKIEPFGVEMWMNEWEARCQLNLAETCVRSLTIEELLTLAGRNEADLSEPLPMKMTYGPIEGSERLRDAIAALYDRQSRDNIVVTHGTIGANMLCHKALVERGDKVIAVVPTYQQHYSIPESIGADVQLMWLREENGFLPDLDELRDLATADTKLIALNNPNNPTGALMDRALLEQIAEIARDCDAWILCDEVYRGTDQEGSGTTASIADVYEKGIGTAGMSKAYALAGLRLGWVAAPREMIEAVMIHRDYDTISVGMIDDHFAALALENRERILARSRAITRDNLATAKAWGVRDMAFHKKAGLRIEDMVTSKWVYRKLRNFRAGIEAGISCLKRVYGLARCTWRGLDHFKAYVWSSVVAYNLVLFTRLKAT